MKHITIDGRQLSYPGTGLFSDTVELLQTFQELGYASSISVFVEQEFNPSDWDLSHLDVQWIFVNVTRRNSALVRWLSKAMTVPEPIERLIWANCVVQQLKKFSTNSQHLIPYLYNYGDLKKNIAIVPDLLYRIVNEETLDPRRPWWWNLRYKLPLRVYFRRWEETLVAQAKYLIVHSNFVKNHAYQELNIPFDRMFLIPQGIPRWIVEKYDRDRDSLIKHQYFLPDRFVLYVGGFSPRKNIPLLLRACGRIYERDCAFRCVFVGLTEGFIQSGLGTPIREVMNNSSIRAAAVNLPKLSYSELASLYRLANFIVYPSLSEGFGLPILEAAAAGKLCLCGDNSSMREIQPNARYRLDSTDEDAWVEAILKFWQNPAETEIASQQCGELVRNYSWQKSAEKLWKLLQQ